MGWSKSDSFLTKVGKALSIGFSFASEFIPVLRPFVGSGAVQEALIKGQQIATIGQNDLTAIGTIVVQIEAALQGVPGPQRLQAASSLIGPIVDTAEFLMGTETADVAEFNAGVKDLTNAIVRISNARKPKFKVPSGDPMPSNAPATPTQP